ncbi:MAG TPA: hypothetical protein VKV37_21560 [Ktedonobacteraceae bacterium]|jgi:hypothetical protein|nr:hypothetical protein [Ktedonobacteraceae bacterium]
MVQNEVVDGEQSPFPASTSAPRAVEIPGALPVRLQTLDLARHVAIAPDGKRYVVASFDDRLLGRDYVTAIYPQQYGYLTMVRLVVYEVSSATPQQAIEQHIALVRAIQQGRLDEVIHAQRDHPGSSNAA